MTFRRLLLWLVVLGAGAYGAQRYRTAREDSAAAADSAGTAAELAPTPRAFGPARTIGADLPPAPEGPEVRMLFIGNSLTYTWAMPQMLTDLARVAGINLVTEQHAIGGMRLVQQVSDPTVQKLLDSGGWTSVVLQEQSQWPAFSDAQVRAEVDPPAHALAERARAGTPGVRIVFYGTAAKKNGDPQNSASIPELATYDGMQDRITATYRRLSRDIGGVTVPAGEAWRAVRRAHPDVELYGDDTHPNKAGAYLIACAFYGAMFARSPVGLPYTAGLDASLAAELQRFAWDAVIAEASHR